MATLKTIIKKAKGKPVLNSAGETTIYIKYTHDEKHMLISTRVRVLPKQWDGENNQAYPVNGLGRTTKNNLIAQTRQIIEKTVSELNYKGKEPTIEAVRSYLKQSKVKLKVDTYELYDKYLESSETIKSKVTVDGLKRSKNNFIEFCKAKRISPTLDNIDLQFYNLYVKYFLNKRGMSNNSVGKEVKNLKSFLHYCENHGNKISLDVKKFKVFKEKPNIIYITQDELDQLYNYDFSKNLRLDRVRDLFCLGCYTGLRWSDLSRLSKDHIEGNIIRMRAHKNKTDTLIPLTPRSAAILQKYDYKLPIISEQNLNVYIKEACQIVGIDQPIEKVVYHGGKKTYTRAPKYEEISSHNAVKTFITICGEKGISAKVVAQITGKTVKVILDHYYGIDQKTIVSEMAKAFGGV